jgi:5-methylcytosine-specific restriction protein A
MTRSAYWDAVSRRPWRRIRAAQLRREPFCVLCYEQGRLIEAAEVDHVVPLSQGGRVDDPANLQSLCHDCHVEKHGSYDRKLWTVGR